ncbi:MAG: alpha/beta fold hydrolase [Solirubrobacterales bacterium]|nr:alpha/beta fold hydrolase [Solirubrobacterales bacterium]
MRESSRVRSALTVAAVSLAFAAAASSATAATKFDWMRGFDAAATPDNLDRVGVLKVGPKKAKNILVLNPGTSASAAYFRPLAGFVASEAKGWQVWAVERRENQLEDQSVVDEAKQGTATTQRLFDYYLGYLTDPSVTDHFESVPDSAVPFARDWGMRVEIEDLRRVVKEAERKAGKRGGEVVLGGHSLGGSITTAYATWDFNGKPGAKGLAGLVYIDGGSGPDPISPEEASQDLAELQAESPWLSFGGITAPFAGLFNVVGSTTTHLEPDAVSKLQTWPLLPDNLKPPVLATNEGAYGFALDTGTSPPALAAAQAHLGHLAASGDPRGWDEAGELTPVQRYADMFSGTGLQGLDGTAWYHPLRLTIDSGAVAAGNANPAQRILDVRATHGDDLSRRLRIYAFGAALGGERVLKGAKILARQSQIPRRRLTLVNREETYAHNDPNSAFPKNAFVKRLTRFLARVERG